MRSPFAPQAVLAMERAAARAWPPQRVERVAGWHVRLSGGGSRRANSVLPLDYDASDLERAIDRVETLYRAERTRSYFQVSSASDPPELDARLAARGYTYEDPCLLLAKRLVAVPMPAGVISMSEPSPDWLSIYTEPLDAGRAAAAAAVLASVPSPRTFLLVVRDGRPLSSALGVVAPDGIALVECVATAAVARRSGGAGLIMNALESWAAGHGAHTAALQVVSINLPAVTLYERRGYSEAGRYHYRFKDVV
jgi:GNAT superfamily N-acetyltransferase